MVTVFSLVPLILLLIIVVGNGAMGLVFLALFNVFASLGAGSYVYYTDTYEYEIPQEKP